jgi:hypothetical protein
MYPEDQIVRIAKQEGVPATHISKIVKGLRKEDKSEEVLQSNLKKVLPKLR